MGDYAAAYPDARLLAPPGLARRRGDLTFAAELGETPEATLAADIDQQPLLGHRHLTEIFFLHRASGTLIAGDACCNATSGLGLPARLWAGGRRIGPTPAFRRSIRDRDAARRSLERVLARDFDRLIPGHGDAVEHGGHAALERAYAWLGS